jgi:hypothetical protein
MKRCIECSQYGDGEFCTKCGGKMAEVITARRKWKWVGIGVGSGLGLLLVLGIGIGMANSWGRTIIPADYTIRVSSTSSVDFSGNILVIEASGKSTSRSVEGYTPMEYRVTGTTVSCSFQKQQTAGYMEVEILRDGKVVNMVYTIASYGVVSVTN